MPNLSLEAWKNVKQTQQKFDYFVVGLSSALFAYVGSNFTPSVLSFSQNSFELGALTCLFVSILFGVLRIEGDISVLSIDYRKVQARERLDVVNKILNFPYRNVNLDTGSEISESEALEQQKVLKEFITKSTLGLDKLGGRYKNFYIARNIFLLLGFLLLVASKFVSFYLLLQSA